MAGRGEVRKRLLTVAEAADHVFFDIKHTDSARHVDLTGVPNQLILDNLRALLHVHHDVTVRYPLVPGCNDGGDDLRAFAHYLLGLPRLPRVELVPYHRFGEHKYRLLGRTYQLEGTQPCREQEAEDARVILAQHGISCSALVH